MCLEKFWLLQVGFMVRNPAFNHMDWARETVSTSISNIYNFRWFYKSTVIIPSTDSFYNIGIKHVVSCINIHQVPWEVLKTEAEGRSFQHLPRDLANVNALKKPCLTAIIA